MRTSWIRLVLLLILMCGVGMACSDTDDQDSEKGVIEQMTDKAAKKMADRITAPVDRARDAQGQAEDRLKDIQEAMPEE